MIENQFDVSVDEESLPPAGQLDKVLMLHRHTDGYITFSVGDGDGNLYPRDAILASELESLFPQVAEGYLKDSYVSINASWRALRRHNTAISKPMHRTENLRYLNACYVDIDCYTRKITEGTAIGMVHDLHVAGVIPAPSLYALSGRGVWALWFLKDPNQETPQRAFADRIELYVRVNRAIGEILERALNVGVDPVTDAARHVRLPGSLNTKSEKRVAWLANHLEDGTVPLYTLKDLSEAMHLPEATKRQVPSKRDATSKKYPNKAKAWAVRLQNYLEDFKALMRMRGGGFDKGMREKAALLYGYILKANGYAIEEAMLEVSIMAARCRPPLPKPNVLKQVKSAYTRRWSANAYGHDRVSIDLNITDLEAMRLKKWKAAPKYRVIKEPPPTPQRTAENLRRRDEALLQIVMQRNGVAPPAREMAALLQQRGFQVERAKVNLDYKRLGVKTERTLQHEAAEARRQNQRRQMRIPLR